MATVSGFSAPGLPSLKAEVIDWIGENPLAPGAEPVGGRALRALFASGPGVGGPPAAPLRSPRDAPAALTPRGERDTRLSVEILAEAESFYVGPRGTATVRAAAPEMPSYRLHPEDVPSARGFMVWSDPPVDDEPFRIGGEGQFLAPMQAVSWSAQDDRVAMSMWASRENNLRIERETPAYSGSPASEKAFRVAYPRLLHISAITMPYYEDKTVEVRSVSSLRPGASWVISNVRAVLATWLLRSQGGVMTEETVSAPRTDLKRLARSHPELAPQVRILDMRPRCDTPVPGQVAAKGTGRPLTKRVPVRGHWKNHWYPARQDHRPLFITEHERGPKEAPRADQDRETVYRFSLPAPPQA